MDVEELIILAYIFCLSKILSIQKSDFIFKLSILHADIDIKSSLSIFVIPDD